MGTAILTFIAGLAIGSFCGIIAVALVNINKNKES